ncbi:MAG: hypothetical protein M3463_05645 [Verrucomicrobiota bacterium]|nr:hypothetical protein [Verrucomicrobiota bacterium]
MIKTALFGAAIALATFSDAARGALINSGFEDGLSEWTVSGSVIVSSSSTIPPPTPAAGNASTETFLTGVPTGPFTDVSPTEGSSFALLTTRDVTATKISQTFVLPEAQAQFTLLTFDFRFLTDESFFSAGATFNDGFIATLTPQFGAPIAMINRDDLQPGGVGPLTALATEGVGGFLIGTQWLTASVDVSAFLGQTATLEFVVWDVADSLGDSAVAIDNINFVPVPEPGAAFMPLAGFLWAFLGRRRRAAVIPAHV